MKKKKKLKKAPHKGICEYLTGKEKQKCLDIIQKAIDGKITSEI